MEAEEEASFRLMLDSLEIGESGWCTPLDTPPPPQQWPHWLFLAGQGCLKTPPRVAHPVVPLVLVMPLVLMVSLKTPVVVPLKTPLMMTLKPPLVMALKAPLVKTHWGIFVAQMRSCWSHVTQMATHVSLIVRRAPHLALLHLPGKQPHLGMHFGHSQFFSPNAQPLSCTCFLMHRAQAINRVQIINAHTALGN